MQCEASSAGISQLTLTFFPLSPLAMQNQSCSLSLLLEKLCLITSLSLSLSDLTHSAMALGEGRR
jgi:hypothetical protein